MKTFDEHFRNIEMEGGEVDSFDFGGDGSVDYYAVIEITDEDRDAFPDDIATRDRFVVIHHDNYGFVDVTAVPESDVEHLRLEFDDFMSNNTQDAD